jgi:hypothetical protein
MVIGTAGELPKPPAEPIKFLEDMDDTELADAVGSKLLRDIAQLRSLAWHARWSQKVSSEVKLHIFNRLTLHPV